MKVFATLKVINIIIGCICLGLGSHVYSETNYITVPDIDVILLIIVASAMTESIIALLTAYHYKDVQYRYSFINTIQRGIICITVVVVGGFSINSAYQVRDQCVNIPDGCQPFEAKLVAGILCVINGVLYGIARKHLGQACAIKVYGYQSESPYSGGPPQNFSNTPMEQVPTGPTMIPRFHPQTPSGYKQNQNYNQNQMPSNYPQRQQQQPRY